MLSRILTKYMILDAISTLSLSLSIFEFEYTNEESYRNIREVLRGNSMHQHQEKKSQQIPLVEISIVKKCVKTFLVHKILANYLVYLCRTYKY